jgi:hypothetical protein
MTPVLYLCGLRQKDHATMIHFIAQKFLSFKTSQQIMYPSITFKKFSDIKQSQQASLNILHSRIQDACPIQAKIGFS